MSITRSQLRASGYGAFCRFCGDYEIVSSRRTAMMIEANGCARCLHEGPSAGFARAIGGTAMGQFNGIIFDCEIEQVPVEQEDWRRFDWMGLTVIGVYDYVDDAVRVFCKDNLIGFRQLVADRQWIVGFNSIKFDNPLVRAHGVEVPDSKSFDILQELWRADGLGPEFNPRTHGGYGLGRACQVNFGWDKSGDGASAPLLWQQGRIGEVIDYCLRDVWLCRQLMDRILRDQPIRNPKRSYQTLTLRNPLRFLTKEKTDEQSRTGDIAATE